MAKREWIGNYTLNYKVYYSYKDEWVSRFTDLGHCLGRDEAISKAVAFLINCEETVKPVSIVDGFNNNIIA